MSPDDRLRAALGSPELAWLVDRLARRVELGHTLDGKLRLGEPTERQRAALARLTGTYGRGNALVVDLDDLASRLSAAGVVASLHLAVTTLRGPLVVRADAAARLEAAWDQAFDGLDAPGWQELRSSGLVKRLVSGDPLAGAALLAQAAAIVALLPASGIPLAEVAAATGDAHALDPGRPLATVVLRLVRGMTGADPADRRAAWASVGVEVDPLSSSVLMLGVRARGTGLVPSILRNCAEAGEPCRLTLRQIRDGLDVEGEEVFVCENPSVVLAAADRLGPHCRPLVCVEGQPGSAVRIVLAAAGARVRYHGDFDWPGVRIAGEVLATTGGAAWRFGARAYQDAPKGMDLAGAPVETPWDGDLADGMRSCGRAVHEEAVIGTLIADLSWERGDGASGGHRAEPLPRIT